MAYPFQPMNSYILEKLSDRMKEPRSNIETNFHKKDSNTPDNITPETNHSISDRFCNHSQTDK